MAGKAVEIGSADEREPSHSRNERSTISFPYNDLKDALSVADAIHQNAGTSCSVEQLAAYLGQTARSGAFRMKLSTARIFGLVETGKGEVSLTDLGRRIVDTSSREQAKATAFLTVPLYSAVYEKYKGGSLPPTAGLQREMAALGVARKQVSKARQAFERSAKRAGFFGHGNDRLVAPNFRGTDAPSPPSRSGNPSPGDGSSARPGGGGGGGGGDGTLHPFIRGLVETLPKPGSKWPSAEREKWLRTAEHIFSLIYVDEDPQEAD